MRMPVAVLAWLALLAASAHAASPATTTFRGDATRDNRVTGAPEPGLGVLWARDLGGAVSYPVVAGSTVFVSARTSGDAYGTTVAALDLATGAVRWTRPIAGTYYWSGLAHDGGRLFVLDFDGDLTALSPATGATLWTRDLPGQYAFDSPPAARDGRVYAIGAGSGGTAYGVRASDGVVEWTRTLPTGGGSPAVDDTSAYVSFVCATAYALNRATGAVRWEHLGDCTGGGDVTPAVHGSRVYPLGDNGAIYAAGSGAVVGSADFHGAPAFADSTAFVPWNGGLLAVDAASWAGRWTSSVGGLSPEAPLVSASHVYAGSDQGFVVALRRSDGGADWCASTAGEPVGTGTGNVDRPDSGLGAGDGRLLVPAGRFLVAYGPGGAPPARCTSVPVFGTTGAGGSPGSAQAGPSLTLLPARRHTIAGRRLRLGGRLAGAPAVAAQPVTVEGDAWPFDGRWRRRGTATTGGDGTWTLTVRPGRNTRYRALAAGLTSAEATVWAELAADFRRKRLGGLRFRETWIIKGPRSARVKATRAHFYLVRRGSLRARRARSVPLRRVRRGVYRATARLRFLGSVARTVVIACYRERTPDPYGEPVALDRRCGARRLTLARPAARAASVGADATAHFIQRGG
jgi:outer membrane protein assembly factor BamB